MRRLSLPLLGALLLALASHADAGLMPEQAGSEAFLLMQWRCSPAVKAIFLERKWHELSYPSLYHQEKCCGGEPGPALAKAEAAQAADNDGNDAAREAVTFTRYDLDLHIRPVESRMSAVARLTVRNDGKVPLTRVALALSSTLAWEAVSERVGERVGDGAPVKLGFDARRLDTDADHSGAESEAVVTLAHALAPGASAELTAIYSGTIAATAARLERSGAPATQAESVDWDRIGEDGTFLRGFGNVLWYPVSATRVFLGDGARLAEMTGEQRLRQRTATARLRVQVEYTGEAPRTVIFCGHSQSLRPLEEDAGATASEPAGIATAEFPAMALGFASPSLFVVKGTPQIEGRTVGVVTMDTGAAERVETAAKAAQAVVTEWLGAIREREPLLLDHAGQPFAQGALLVESAGEADGSFAMVHLLSHAWFASGEVWLDEGMAQFLPIVALERERGRLAALAQLEDQRPALALAESNAPAAGSGGTGGGLATASREVFYRNKAVAVLWMLRGLVGDEAMKKALATLRGRPVAERGAAAFEAALESASGKELAWFFKDWVMADKGLPELSIVSAAARASVGRSGAGEGYLVAVEVRNEGGAAAEVPVTVRSGELTATERLRVPGGGVASTRILFQGRPQQVEVNDGSVPEVGVSRHVRELVF